LQGVIENTDIGVSKLKEKIQEFTLRRDQLKQDYRKEAANQLSELQKSMTELRQQLIVADDAQRRIDVRAPITGVVQQLRIFTVGGVLRPGDPILDIVPVSEDLIIKARVSPLDADRVAANMHAEVRFPSFRHLGLQIINGKVTAVSRDRLVDDATKDAYFDAQISVDRKELPDTVMQKLSAGMPAEVVIPTGERTVFSYLVSPLLERFQTSMRER
jgi:HlyD family type I secretion membrane fusion protein